MTAASPDMIASAVERALAIQGWMFEAELVWLAETASRMSTVAEIGCWKGRATTALLSACPGTVYAIDHFQGSEGEPCHAEALDGSVRREFYENVGHFGNLRVVERDSFSAAQLFGPGEMDMVFIDGAHGYDDVLCDLMEWTPKARRMIAGHDYAPTEWPGVVRAVEEYFTVRRNLQVKRAAESIWYAEVNA